MGKILCFIGTEKSLSNIFKYNFFEKLFNDEIVIVTTSKIADQFKSRIKLISYSSNWSPVDIDTFNLHLLFRNFFTRNNIALNYELRNRVFGPYKIRSIKIALYALKYFKISISRIKWIFLFKNLFKSSHQILLGLRVSGKINQGDYSSLYRILTENKITTAIAITPFRDPKIYDLAQACHDSNTAIHILTECWDNVSSGYGIPDNITMLHLWSKQQLQEVSKFYPQYYNKSEIIGSYRRTYSQDFRGKTHSHDNEFNILYLEGYFYENLNYTINKILEALVESDLVIKNNKINLVVRKYPLKRQSVNLPGENNWIGPIKLNQCTIDVSESKLSNLNDEYQNTDLVFSELTTAGLEAQFRCIRTYFIGSHASPRFLDSAAGYNFPFAQPIKKSKNFFNLSIKKDFYRLVDSLTNLSVNDLGSYGTLDYLENINFYAEPFDFAKWESLIKDLNE
jgi:hypothetical protein